MILNEVSEVGELVLQKKLAAVIGLSIRNNYFRGNTIESIANWAKEHFSKLVFMLPDEPAIDTLCGLGYDPAKAKQKAMSACNNLENKSRRIIAKLGISDKARVVRWAELQNNARYKQSCLDMLKLYNYDQSFRNDARHTTRQVMISQRTNLDIEAAIDTGVPFLIKELSFIIAASDILDLGCASAYLYHRPLAIYQNLLAGRYAYTPPKDSGYIVCEVEADIVANPQFAEEMLIGSR
jgi:cyclo(L-tyrosyl-L-tyrosyl) synthase